MSLGRKSSSPQQSGPRDTLLGQTPVLQGRVTYQDAYDRPTSLPEPARLKNARENTAYQFIQGAPLPSPPTVKTHRPKNPSPNPLPSSQSLTNGLRQMGTVLDEASRNAAAHMIGAPLHAAAARDSLDPIPVPGEHATGINSTIPPSRARTLDFYDDDDLTKKLFHAHRTGQGEPLQIDLKRLDFSKNINVNNLPGVRNVVIFGALDRTQSFPMPAAAFKQKVDSRQAKAREHMEKRAAKLSAPRSSAKR